MKITSIKTSRFIFKKDLVKYIIKELENQYITLPYTLELENQIINYIRNIEKNNSHIINEGDLEVSFSDNRFIKIHSKSGYKLEELI